jgi:hypothetical protein
MPLSTGDKIYFGFIISSALICFGCLIGILQINSKYGYNKKPPSIQRLRLSLIIILFISAICFFSLIIIPAHGSSNNGPGVGTQAAQTFSMAPPF